MANLPNINLKTGIAYGYISANALDPEIVDALLYGAQARNLSYERAELEASEAANIAAAERGIEHGSRDWEDFIERETEAALESYEDYEAEIEGEYEGVHYATSWLGGALNFWIFESPYTTDKARRASPCVPGAGILDTLDGSVSCYDVPEGWRCV